MKRLVLFVAGAVLACGALAQQQYPSRPIRMIVPWPPGQATDLAGRVVALKLSDLLGQQVIAQRPGASGGVGHRVELAVAVLALPMALSEACCVIGGKFFIFQVIGHALQPAEIGGGIAINDKGSFTFRSIQRLTFFI